MARSNHPRLSVLSSLLLAASSANAYSFKFNKFPTQCGEVDISIERNDGNDGTPPFRLSVIPFGGSPVGDEVRVIMDLPFNNSDNIKFNLPYPQDSQFVAVVSDRDGSGFGSGGVTIPVNVEPSENNNDSCLPTSEVAPPFTFYLSPENLETCRSGTFIPSSTQGQVRAWGIIPGGNAFVIPTSGGGNVSWTPPIRPQVNIIVVLGDNRGFGAGGSVQLSVQPGGGNTGCIEDDSPSSTTGNPAGGAYPTNSDGGTTTPTPTQAHNDNSEVVSTSTNSDGSTVTNTSAASGYARKPQTATIVGAVLGSVLGAILLFFCCLFLVRRRRRQNYENSRVSILGDHHTGPTIFSHHGHSNSHSNNSNLHPSHPHGERPMSGTPFLPAMYTSTPFRGEDETSDGGSRSHAHSQSSLGAQTDPARMSGEDGAYSPVALTAPGGGIAAGMGAGAGTKSPPPFRPLRDVYQHQDGGRFGMGGRDEIPPAYTGIRG